MGIRIICCKIIFFLHWIVTVERQTGNRGEREMGMTWNKTWQSEPNQQLQPCGLRCNHSATTALLVRIFLRGVWDSRPVCKYMCVKCICICVSTYACSVWGSRLLWQQRRRGRVPDRSAEVHPEQIKLQSLVDLLTERGKLTSTSSQPGTDIKMTQRT